MDNAISIQAALADMAEAGADKPFRIAFVRSTGKGQGTIKECLAYYGAPNPKVRMPRAHRFEKNYPNRKRHLDSNTIPLTEVGKMQLITPRIDHIIGYQGKQVIH